MKVNREDARREKEYKKKRGRVMSERERERD